MGLETGKTKMIQIRLNILSPDFILESLSLKHLYQQNLHSFNCRTRELQKYNNNNNNKKKNELSKPWTQQGMPVGLFGWLRQPAVSWNLCQVHRFAASCAFYMCKGTKRHGMGPKDVFRVTQRDITPFARPWCILLEFNLYFNLLFNDFNYAQVLTLFIYMYLFFRVCWSGRVRTPQVGMCCNWK